jgi:hypothetical protein
MQRVNNDWDTDAWIHLDANSNRNARAHADADRKPDSTIGRPHWNVARLVQRPIQRHVHADVGAERRRGQRVDRLVVTA